MPAPVPILAAGGVDAAVLIVGAIILIAKWLIKTASDARPPAPLNSGTRPPAATEEERARRFREALGLPPDGGPTSMRAPAPTAAEMRRERPTSMHGFPPPPPPPPPRKAAEFPVPPIIYEQRPRRQKRVTPPPPPPRDPMPSLDELPAPKTRAEQITAGELKVPEYRELQTKSSEVQAIPFERRASSASSASGQPSTAAELRVLLRRRSSLRDAILLREILGPPPGLRSA